MSSGLTQNTFPVGLLLAKKPCLIVGGGKRAARKAEALLAASAKITIIAPALVAELKALQPRDAFLHIARAYKPGDVQGYHLVFAATDDRHLNRTILNECRQAHIHCCPVDGNWMQGDFVTPAVFRKDNLSVAISTGGQNCRRSRLIKENLERHLDLVDSADLVVMGVSHQQTHVSERDALQLQGPKLWEAGEMLMQIWGLHSFMLLSTCNRIELLGVKTQIKSMHTLLQRILGFDTLPPASVYIKEGADAFAHTALLASGLLSQMTGENHIVAQIKEALACATEKGWADGMLKEWIDAALHISKEIRRVIPQDQLQGEVEDAAIAYLLEAIKEEWIPSEPRITVLGTGTVGRGLVARLSARSLPCRWVYHRNQPQQVPPGVSLHIWHERTDLLSQSDCVITATSAPSPIITQADAKQLHDRPVLLLDVATPRNIAPTLATTATQIINLDDLKQWQARATGTWDVLMAQAQQIVAEHHPMYQQLMRSFQPEESRD